MELSEEEKKAIEWLEKAEYFSARLYAPTIRNLIDQYQKEIDREKQYSDFYEDLCNKQQAKIKGLAKGNRSLMESRIKWKDRYYKQLKELKEYNKQGQRLSNIMNSKDSYMYKSVCKNFVPKDKVREIINFYENEIDKDGILTKLNSYDLLRAVINRLEELLEEN